MHENQWERFMFYHIFEMDCNGFHTNINQDNVEENKKFIKVKNVWIDKSSSATIL